MKPLPYRYRHQRLEAVLAFTKRFKQPWAKFWIDSDPKHAPLRETLHVEEFEEWRAARTPVDVLDALVDMEYIACGTQVVFCVKAPEDAQEDRTIGLEFAHMKLQIELRKPQLCYEGLRRWLNAYRTALEREASGFNFAGAFGAVHENNMNKGWATEELAARDAATTKVVDMFETREGQRRFVVHRLDGKVVKPPGWVAPDLREFI